VRPLGPKTEKLYAATLQRAFGNGPPSRVIPQSLLESWGEPSLALLRAALRRREVEAGRDPSWIRQAIPRKYAVKRVIRVPGEAEAAAYEKAAAQLPDGVRILALLPLLLGLRAAEVVGLRRDAVETAVKTGDLVVLRKGGEEQIIRVPSLAPLLQELLNARPARPKTILARGPVQPRKLRWDKAGEVLSAGGFAGQYARLRALVRQVGEVAGIAKVHPHLLRHAFATRMNRDGAPLFTVQAALNHKNIATTARYVHASASDVEKFQRPAPVLTGG
jgi:site-specific recombinase XerD